MKLDRLMSSAFAAAAVALACGCSSTAISAGFASNASNASNARPADLALTTGGTTSLMSADIPGPAPKVGKAHLVVDDDLGSDQDAPKDARPSDGSRRGGGFGSVK